MKAYQSIKLAFLLCTLGHTMSGQLAELKLPAIFGDHMVLQQDTEAAIWGWAEPSALVSVTIQGHKIAGKAGTDGKWELPLPLLQTGGPYDMTVSTDKNSKVIKDILVGDVWLGSGQSNMEWKMIQTDNAETEIAKANFPRIRLFTVPVLNSEQPQEDVGAHWVVCTPENIAAFSAVLYYFGKEIHTDQKIPMGLIHSSLGGSPAEMWTSMEVLKAEPDFKRYITGNETALAQQKKDRPLFDGQLKSAGSPSENELTQTSLVGDWDILASPPGMEIQGELTITQNDGQLEARMTWSNEKASNVSLTDNILKFTLSLSVAPVPFEFILNMKENTLNGKVAMPGDTFMGIKGVKREAGEAAPVLTISLSSPAGLFNGMIAPLIPFAIKGAIWYQGESNVSNAHTYRKLFPAMIRDWRTRWELGDFPFYYVQIAPYNYGEVKTASAELREAQFMTLKTRNTGMAVTMDIGNVDDIHPSNKLDVGKRLALWALAKDYGHANLVYSGPLYKSMKIEGNSIRISFDHVGGGLVSKNGKLTHFEIAGEDQKFLPANAAIDGNTIIVSNNDINKPVAVRFAWLNTATPNLLNREGLPASSFRTDDWEGVTD